MARLVGSKNKQPVALRHLAQQYTGEALKQLFNIMTKSKIEVNRLAAVQQILDRGYGKPTQAVGGDPESPLVMQIATKESIDAWLQGIVGSSSEEKLPSDSE